MKAEGEVSTGWAVGVPDFSGSSCWTLHLYLFCTAPGAGAADWGWTGSLQGRAPGLAWTSLLLLGLGEERQAQDLYWVTQPRTPGGPEVMGVHSWEGQTYSAPRFSP